MDFRQRRTEMNQEPKSLQEAVIYFSNPDNCIDYIAMRRWLTAWFVPVAEPRRLASMPSGVLSLFQFIL
jgi:hypothetical protein